jgi:4-hydroxy-3-methylbut-2-enyl diphosphate reductase IspH
MNHVESVARFNNEAVSLLMAGKTQIAIETFMKSVALLKVSSFQQEQQEQQVSSWKKSKFSPQDIAIEADSSQASSQTTFVENVCIYQASSPLPSLAGRQNYIYNRAFRFSMEDIICRRTTRRTAAVERTAHIIDVAIIIFNAALAYHVGSLNGNKAYAKRSIMLYSKVLKLLKNSRSFAGSSTASVVVKVAAMNNISQLRFEEGEYHRAQEGLDQLSQLISILKDAPRQQELDENEYREILMNIIFFLNTPKVAAAA